MLRWSVGVYGGDWGMPISRASDFWATQTRDNRQKMSCLLFRTDFMASGKLWAEPAHKKGKFCTTKGPVYDETDTGPAEHGRR